MHKEGITELHHYLKAYPHKKPKVDKILESTGTAFRKYITRALASRATEDEERENEREEGEPGSWWGPCGLACKRWH